MVPGEIVLYESHSILHGVRCCLYRFFFGPRRGTQNALFYPRHVCQTVSSDLFSHRIIFLLSIFVASIFFYDRIRPFGNKNSAHFLSMAIANGLTSAITNPIETEIRQAIYAADMLAGHDENCMNWIRANREPSSEKASTNGGSSRRRRRRTE